MRSKGPLKPALRTPNSELRTRNSELRTRNSALDLPPLPDYLRPGLPLLFVGYNPGETSARLGHYYAFAHNLFWPALYESGLVPAPLTFVDDYRLPEFGIGITDLAKRPSRAAGDLPTSEFRSGREALRGTVTCT